MFSISNCEHLDAMATHFIITPLNLTLSSLYLWNMATLPCQTSAEATRWRKSRREGDGILPLLAYQNTVFVVVKRRWSMFGDGVGGLPGDTGRNVLKGKPCLSSCFHSCDRNHNTSRRYGEDKRATHILLALSAGPAGTKGPAGYERPHTHTHLCGRKYSHPLNGVNTHSLFTNSHSSLHPHSPICPSSRPISLTFTLPIS